MDLESIYTENKLKACRLAAVLPKTSRCEEKELGGEYISFTEHLLIRIENNTAKNVWAKTKDATAKPPKNEPEPMYPDYFIAKLEQQQISENTDLKLNRIATEGVKESIEESAKEIREYIYSYRRNNIGEKDGTKI